MLTRFSTHLVALGGKRMRILILAGLLCGMALGHGVLLTVFNVAEQPGEQQFGAIPAEARIAIYVQSMSIDPVNEAMRMRITVMPPLSHERSSADVTDRELAVLVRHDGQVERVVTTRGQPYPEFEIGLNLNRGNIRDYPLDTYFVEIGLSCSGIGQTVLPASLPLHVVSWEGILGYNVRGRQIAEETSDEILLRFTVDRTGANKFFVCTIYAAILFLQGLVLTIGALVFIGIRKIEVTMIGALVAIVFTLPVIRNTLPGSPPLGIRADVAIFFWAELSAILALGLFVAAWARRGAPP